MPEPDVPVREQLSPEEQRRVTRAALLRPMHLLVAVIGIAFSAMTLAWWVLPITLVTYLALVYLAARDPIFTRRILRGRGNRSGTLPAPSGAGKASAERRVRRLSDQEIRQKIEAALNDKDRALIALDSSDEATRSLFQDVPPKLELLIERLVDVSEKRERVIGRSPELTSDGLYREASNVPSAQEEARELHAIDAHLSETFEKISALRSRVIRISTEDNDNAEELASRLIADLDEAHRRLESLVSRTSPH